MHPLIREPVVSDFIGAMAIKTVLTCERPRYIETVSDMYRNLPSAATAIAKPSRD